MSKAKYYIYKNLHTGTWSVRYKGKVIAHPSTITAIGVEYRVSQATRKMVIAEKKKYVHAYVVATDWQSLDHLGGLDNDTTHGLIVENYPEVKYNPYKNNCFTMNDKEIIKSDIVHLINGRVYARESESTIK